MCLAKLSYSNREKADLYIRSVYSDGVHTPRQIAELAALKQLSVIALTDHAEIAGIKDLIIAAAALGVYVIPGVELNSSQGDFLGYFIDYQDGDFLKFLEEIRDFTGTLSARKCIMAIRQAGGIVVSAHPHCFLSSGHVDIKKYFTKLANLGVVGFETVLEDDVKTSGIHSKIRKKATELGLIPLGGSNSHGSPVSNREIGSGTIGCDIIKKLDTLLPENCLYKSYIKRIYWRWNNLTKEEFTASLSPIDVVIDTMEFGKLLDRPRPPAAVPPGFLGIPFVLIRGEAVKKIDAIIMELNKAGAKIMSITTADNYHEIAWDLYYDLTHGAEQDLNRDIARFDMDRYLFGSTSTECRIIFFSQSLTCSFRILKTKLRQTIGPIQFYKLTCKPDLRELYHTASLLHMPEEENIALECWRLKNCGVNVLKHLKLNQKTKGSLGDST